MKTTLEQTVSGDLEKKLDLITCSYSDIETRRTIYILKNKKPDGSSTKISDVVDFMPAGICIKSETGMGATTSEILAKRDSIIVQPARFTTWSKYQKNGGVFVGTKPGSGKKATNHDEIFAYLRDDSKTPKKIFCVIDSLPKVLECISQVEFQKIQFHGFLDETDTVQTEANFRNSMNIGMEIYKSFPIHHRTTVTATHIGFSDPDLQEEPITEFRYENPTPRKVHLIKTDNFFEETISTVTRLLVSYPTEKILMPANDFRIIHAIISELTNSKKLLDEDEVKIICSKNSEADAGKFFSEIKGEKLPGRLNFMTSAFHTGFDLEESYHSVVISSAKHPGFFISELRHKQISGRSRTGLLSDTIILDLWKSKKLPNHKKEYYFKEANQLIKSFDCVLFTYKNSTRIKEEILSAKKTLTLLGHEDGYSLIFMDEKAEFKIAYNNIDSLLEKTRVNNEIFLNPDGMQLALENLGLTVDCDATSYPPTKIKKTTTAEHCNQLDKVSKELWDTAKFGGIVDTSITKFGRLGKEIIQLYNDNHRNFDTYYLVSKIVKTFKSKKGSDYTTTSGISKQLKSLKESLWYASLTPDHVLRAELEKHLKPNQTWDRDELKRVVITGFEKTFLLNMDWLKFVRSIFNVDDVYGHPGKIKLVSYRIDPDKVRFNLKSQGTFINN